MMSNKPNDLAGAVHGSSSAQGVLLDLDQRINDTRFQIEEKTSERDDLNSDIASLEKELSALEAKLGTRTGA